MFELRGILPRIYREERRSESFASRVVKKESKIRYDGRRARWHKEKFSKIWPRLRRGWFYHFLKG